MIVVKDFPGEIWKDVIIEHENATNEIKLQISNYGRVKSFGKDPHGRLLKGSEHIGYRVIRVKLLMAREEEIQEQLDSFREQIIVDSKTIKSLEKQLKQLTGRKLHRAEKEIAEKQKKLTKLKKKYQKYLVVSGRKRSKDITLLVHRLVAIYFLEQPSPEHNLVIHLDFNKFNNYYGNLKWATQAECTAHQQNSPFVIADKERRKTIDRVMSKGYKLTTGRVSLIKKKIAEGMSLRTLAKQFKVTEMQIRRIKSGENWGYVPAAH